MLKSLLFTLLASVSLSAIADTTRSDRLVADANSVVAEMARGEFEKVTARFDAKMQESLSLERLRTTWASLEQQAGKFQHSGAATSSEHDGYFIVVVPCEFENTALDAKVVYDSDDKMAGLLLTPHAAAP